MAFDLSDYVDVAERINAFRDKHPEGSLQGKYEIHVLEQGTFIAYCAQAFRSPDDPRPGVGTAWEPFPGQTRYTKNSELQNAETSAWGRAIVAVLAADTKRGVASADEVRNRMEDRTDHGEMDTPPGSEGPRPQRHSKSVSSGGGTDETRVATEKQQYMVAAKLKKKGYASGAAPVGWLFGPVESLPMSKVNDALEFIDALPEQEG